MRCVFPSPTHFIAPPPAPTPTSRSLTLPANPPHRPPPPPPLPGSCAGRVRRLLEECPDVVSASVNLSTETALARVRVTAPGGSDSPIPDDFDRLKAKLVEIVKKGGFAASVRPLTSVGGVDALLRKREDKLVRNIIPTPAPSALPV